MNSRIEREAAGSCSHLCRLMQYPHVTSGHVEQGAVHLDFLLSARVRRKGNQSAKTGRGSQSQNVFMSTKKGTRHPISASTNKVLQMVAIQGLTKTKKRAPFGMAWLTTAGNHCANDKEGHLVLKGRLTMPRQDVYKRWQGQKDLQEYPIFFVIRYLHIRGGGVCLVLDHHVE